MTFIRHRLRKSRNNLALAAVISAIALAGTACGDSSPDQKEQAPAAVATEPAASLPLEWTDMDLEKMAQRIGYGKNPSGLLRRSPDGALLFVPETKQDHIASGFIPVPADDGERSLELVLDVKTAGGPSCEGTLQDQAFNVLVVVPCRTTGEHKATAKIAASVSAVRLYFPSPKGEQIQLPTRVHVVEHN